MKKEQITSLKTLSDKKYVKFGIEYAQALIQTESFYATYPYYSYLNGFNEIISEIINAYYDQGRKLVINTVFADENCVSAMINGVYALNYSIKDSCLLPPSLVLKVRGINNRTYRSHVKGYEKGCVDIIETLRFAPDGVRVELNTRSGEKVTLKIRTLK